LREFSLAKRGELLLTLEEVDTAHVAGRVVTAVDLLHEAWHLTKARPSFDQAMLKLRLVGPDLMRTKKMTAIAPPQVEVLAERVWRVAVLCELGTRSEGSRKKLVTFPYSASTSPRNRWLGATTGPGG
jgi:hypothetical protein